MGTNHLTLALPMKSSADARAAADMLPSMMPDFFQALEAIGTVHYSRFTLLNDKTLLYLADFDGEFSELMRALAVHAGPIFDAIFQHVVDPPPTPVAGNVEAFVDWAGSRLLDPLLVYSAYPGTTARGDQDAGGRRRRGGRGASTAIPGGSADEVAPRLY